MNPITNKREMYKLFEAGVFGNKTLSWDSWDKYMAYFYDHWYPCDERPVALRYMEKPGGPCVYDLWYAQATRLMNYWLEFDGLRREFIHISECVDKHRIVLAGEVARSEGFLDLTYYDTPGHHMRDGLFRFSNHDQGLSAHLRIKSAMDPTSWDNLHHLFDLWPDHVIEFTCCSYSFGTERWNTSFWECRRY